MYTESLNYTMTFRSLYTEAAVCNHIDIGSDDESDAGVKCCFVVSGHRHIEKTIWQTKPTIN